MTRHLIHLSLILFLSLPLHAQEPEISAIPGVAKPLPEEKIIRENLEYLALSGNDLAALYRKYTGKRVIVSSGAAKAEFEFIQPASAEDPLTYAEAAELLKKAATIENFIFVPDATDPNLTFLTLATAGIRPTNRGVPIFTELDKLPDGDAVISYVMTFTYIKPDEAIRTFTQVIGQVGPFGSIAAVPNAAAVVITENTSLIRKLIKLKEEIDKPSSQVEPRFIDVKFADVTELATTLNDLLGNQQGAASRSASTPQQNQNNAPPNAQNLPTLAQGPATAGEDVPVQIIPDPRTNRIIAMGRPVDLTFVESLIRQFDTESDQRNFLRRKLKYVAVADFLPIAGDALTRAFSGTGTGDAAQTAGNQTSSRQSNFSGGSNNNQNNQGIGNSSGGGSGGGNRADSLSDPDVNSAPVSLLVGRTLLVADNINNSLVIQGPPSGVEIIERLIDQVDVKAQQVMISTVFGQLTLGESTSTGVDWIRAFRGNDEGGLAFSNIGSGINNANLPENLNNPATGAAGSGGFIAGNLFPGQTGLSVYGKIGNSLAAYINLLSSSSDFTVLSRPSIFTANNQKGTISSGRRIAIPTSSNQFNSSFSTNIEYRDVVLKLEVIPLVNSENEITLQIALVSDDVIGQSDPIEGVGQVPIIGTRELLTTVTVPNNQTIILGGLITTNDTESVTGIPILSEIPGIGRLFSTKTKGVNREELMIFIQPSIVNGGDDLERIQFGMDSRYDVSTTARDFAGDTVLPALEPTEIEPAKAEKTSDKSVRRYLGPVHRR
jgi:type II secretion system protein D